LAIGPVATSILGGRLLALYIFQLKMAQRHEPTPNNPLRRGSAQSLLRLRSGQNIHVLAFAGMRLTHGARGIAQ